jgi:uncharacterized protein (TIGR03382 family)
VSRHTRREVAEDIGVDKIVVWQQGDGLWRWRWFPASGEGEPLLSNEGYESADEAEESARSAYPQTTRVAIEKPDHSLVAESGQAAGKGCGAVLAVLAVAGLVVLRRRKLEREGGLG